MSRGGRPLSQTTLGKAAENIEGVERFLKSGESRKIIHCMAGGSSHREDLAFEQARSPIALFCECGPS